MIQRTERGQNVGFANRIHSRRVEACARPLIVLHLNILNSESELIIVVVFAVTIRTPATHLRVSTLAFIIFVHPLVFISLRPLVNVIIDFLVVENYYMVVEKIQSVTRLE
jgi:hypothetical protein